jgi:hypothetical protein
MLSPTQYRELRIFGQANSSIEKGRKIGARNQKRSAQRLGSRAFLVGHANNFWYMKSVTGVGDRVIAPAGTATSIRKRCM